MGPTLQFLADNLDQLDLALDQLAVRDRNFDRFALMLIDNVVELTLHWYAESLNQENEFFRHSKPQYDPELIAKALGNRFAPKVALAAAQGLLTAEEADSVRSLHSFRNIAYHQGRRHERILHSLTALYLRIACSVLSKLQVSSSSSADEIPLRALKHIGNASLANASEQFGRAWERVSYLAEELGKSLISDLADDMESTIDEFDGALDFLATDGPKPQSRDEVILDSQSWELAFTDEGREYAADRGYVPSHRLLLVDWLKTNYPWAARSDPLPSWRSRLKSLQGETNNHAALKKYDGFMRSTEDLRRAVTSSAIALDAEIQHQIDVARGK